VVYDLPYSVDFIAHRTDGKVFAFSSSWIRPQRQRFLRRTLPLQIHPDHRFFPRFRNNSG
jgi:hypothetical protein